MARLHLALTFAWGLLLVPTLLWWQESVVWVVLMSWYANFSTELNNYRTARASEKIDRAAGPDPLEEVRV